jgi:UDP-glucose 4-epimerase
MNVLVTGGAGFIASNLVERLLEDGHRVLVIDNFATSRHDSLPADAEKLVVHDASIADRNAVEAAYDEIAPDLVVHAAASYKDPDAWEEDIRTNAAGTANIVQAAQERGVGRLIYFQTALCYGNRPLEQPVTLSHPLRPESSYAISKTAGEQYVALSGLDWVSFRLANIFGPRNLSGPIPTFWQRLSEGKKCFAVDTRRDFVFLDDLLEVVLKAAAGTGSGVYHVSSGRDFSIKELYDAVAAAMGSDDPVEERERAPDDAPSILLDPSRTEADFAWSAATPLEEGIGRTIEWYEAHGVEETYSHLRMKD